MGGGGAGRRRRQAEAERSSDPESGGGSFGSAQSSGGGGAQATGGARAGGQARPPGLRSERHARARAGGGAGGTGGGAHVATAGCGRTGLAVPAGRLVDHAEAHAGPAGGATESHGAVPGVAAGGAGGKVRSDHGGGRALSPVGFPSRRGGPALPRVQIGEDGRSRAAGTVQGAGGGCGGLQAVPLPALRLQRRPGRRAYVGKHGAMVGGVCGVRGRDDVRARVEALRGVRARRRGDKGVEHGSGRGVEGVERGARRNVVL